LNHFLVFLQGQVAMLGRRDAIPATVGPVRPPPCVQHHAGHCYNHPGAVRNAGTGRRHCIPYGSTSTATSSPSEDATVNHYARPSKLPLFGSRARHDDEIVARTVKAAAYSAALHTILPHVAK
jgi:hypothetical protein